MRATSFVNSAISDASSAFVGSSGSGGLTAGGFSGQSFAHPNATATPSRMACPGGSSVFSHAPHNVFDTEPAAAARRMLPYRCRRSSITLSCSGPGTPPTVT
jgi:hypothetical protein